MKHSESSKILSVHQPNFLPWIGYFDKINKSDLFVVFDSVQYPRGKSIANRNFLKSKNNKFEIVSPITLPKGRDGKVNYNEVSFATTTWSKKILKTIEMHYQKAPYFEKYFEMICILFQEDNFCELNISFIKQVCQELKITTEIKRLSEYSSVQGKNNRLILGLCKESKCDTYLSGQGAKSYNDQDMYNKEGVILKYQTFKPFEYPQIGGEEFIPYLSVLDLLMNVGDSKSLSECLLQY